jgi:hypothetical protein
MRALAAASAATLLAVTASASTGGEAPALCRTRAAAAALASCAASNACGATSRGSSCPVRVRSVRSGGTFVFRLGSGHSPR